MTDDMEPGVGVGAVREFLTEYGPLAIGWIAACGFAWRLIKVQDKIVADYQSAVRENTRILDKMISLSEGQTRVLDKILLLVGTGTPGRTP
jgi:hypothetical protein